MDFVDEFGHFTSQKSLEIRWFRHMIHHIDTVYSTFTVYRYVVHVYLIYNTILWPHHLTQLKFTHTSKSVWNIIFQAVLPPLPRRNCNCVDGQFSKCRTHTHIEWKIFITSFLCQCTILDFAFWVFITECNGEARRQSAKNAGVLAMDWFPVCGTLRRIIAHRLNVGIRMGEAQFIQ